MESITFGKFLHNIRVRTKGAQIARDVGISYAYLIDLEKGARPVPSKGVLLALADRLPFISDEKERFFDLAAIEKGEVPADISGFICENKNLINLIRQIKKADPSEEFWEGLSHYILLEIEEKNI